MKSSVVDFDYSKSQSGMNSPTVNFNNLKTYSGITSKINNSKVTN